MSDQIDFQAKSDRELLIMTVMQGNECVRHLELINGTLKDHESRLNVVEANSGIGKSINLSKKQAVGLGSATFVFGSFIAGIIERLL